MIRPFHFQLLESFHPSRKYRKMNSITNLGRRVVRSPSSTLSPISTTSPSWICSSCAETTRTRTTFARQTTRRIHSTRRQRQSTSSTPSSSPHADSEPSYEKLRASFKAKNRNTLYAPPLHYDPQSLLPPLLTQSKTATTPSPPSSPPSPSPTAPSPFTR